jgi:thiamine kinase-like enzyme
MKLDPNQRIEDFISLLDFNKIEPGNYITPAANFKRMVKESLFESVGDESVDMLFASGGPEEPDASVEDTEPEKPAEQIKSDVCSFRSSLSDTGHMKGMMPTRGAAYGAAVRSAHEPKKQPSEISVIEKILSAEYKSPVTVTSIRELPSTRKHVKQVFFLINNGISQVWLFKADPKKTAKELAAYRLIYEQGIPTGRPIGYKKDMDSYPFDVAILGGIVEHAGEPYEALLGKMNQAPNVMFSTAVEISKLIATYHQLLTEKQDLFRERGIEIPKASPAKELKERFFAGLGADAKYGSGLVSAVESLCSMQKSRLVVSHGDIHTKNIVTIEEHDGKTGLAKTSVKMFGLIDWESVCLDTPYSDLHDFWIHHKRAAETINASYKFGFDNIINTYFMHFNNKSKQNQIKPNERDSYIQSALWNLYEVFDPTRKNDLVDAEQKAEYHMHAFVSDCNKLRKLGLAEQVREIERNLRPLISSKKNLYHLL